MMQVTGPRFGSITVTPERLVVKDDQLAQEVAYHPEVGQSIRSRAPLHDEWMAMLKNPAPTKQQILSLLGRYLERQLSEKQAVMSAVAKALQEQFKQSVLVLYTPQQKTMAFS